MPNTQRALLACVMAALSTLAINLQNLEDASKTTRASLTAASVRDDPMATREHSFRSVLAAHNRSLPLLHSWRRFVADHADTWAPLVSSLSGAERFSAEAIRAALVAPAGLRVAVAGSTAFRPWTNRWTGRWSNGRMQYHIWGPTRRERGQWIQLVTQSEHRFAEGARLPAMIDRAEVDLAVNVFSPSDGITGWVSKRQHGAVECPCIGYPLDGTTLLWICRAYRHEETSFHPVSWLVYLEHTDAEQSARTYRIYGRQITTSASGVPTLTGPDRHFGTYVAQNERARKGLKLRSREAPLLVRESRPFFGLTPKRPLEKVRDHTLPFAHQTISSAKHRRTWKPHKQHRW